MSRLKVSAAIADGHGGFQLDEVEVDEPIGRELRVSIKAAGLCHTDHASLSWKRPLLMGHEGAGIVEAVGSEVTQFKPGDAVVLNWAIPCGDCFQCQRGQAVLCEVSRPAYVMEPSAAHAHREGTLWRGQPLDRSFNLGTLSPLALVREEAATLLPPGISFPSACIVGCGVMTGFGSAMNVARIQPGDSVAVIGCGGVGLNVIQGARLAGATTIIALDLHAESLERARRFGATDVIQTSKDSSGWDAIVARVKALTKGRGADFAFEATAVPALAAAPLQLTRNGGMALQVSGINDPVTIDMPLFMWNKTYITPLYGGCVPSRDFPRIFGHYLKGELFLDELVTRTYRLEELGEAFDDMLGGRLAKGVVVF
ncbi:MAG TPA: alcohol dehydrogenase catalytic domain-containing protein [Candidatus Limnocylindria bacterium]|jgi:S-(hydroxymethyl)glutathione dehydrogenase/alcohol dehydrogenase|nr:alcohol dehydrogenase catalytic domain-containing protein [Candidatus Limnocylindria bacterium]